MASNLWFLVAVLTLSGCTHNHAKPVKLSKFVNKDVTVERDNGRRLSGTVKADNGAVFVSDKGTTLRSGDIHKVTVVNRGRGAVEGALLGGLTGLGIGVLAGASGGGCSDDVLDVCGFIAGAVMVSMTTVGTLTGLLFGAMAGSRDVYELSSGSGKTMSSLPGAPRLNTQLAPDRVGFQLRWSFGAGSSGSGRAALAVPSL